MAIQKHKTAYRGVRYREHPSRKHGVRADRCFFIRYRVNGQLREESVGWASAGWDAQKASLILAELRKNAFDAKKPATLQEKRRQADAERESDQLLKEREKSQLKTVFEYWSETYKAYAQSTKKAQSFRAEQTHMEKWVIAIVGNVPIVQLSYEHWDSLMTVLMKAKLSQRSKEYIAGTFRRMLAHAKDRGLDVKIPTAKQIGAQAPNDNRRLRILKREESSRILEELLKLDIYTYRLTKFCMMTGCRLGEAAKLTWACVDFQAGTVRFILTKNKDSRTICLPSELIFLMQEFPKGGNAELVFPRHDGKPFTTELRPSLPYYFKKAAELLGLNEGRHVRDRVTFHTIRHTAATRLGSELNVRELMDVMGWKSVSMAARYIHTHDEAKREAANLLEKMWEKGKMANVLRFKQHTENAR